MAVATFILLLNLSVIELMPGVSQNMRRLSIVTKILDSEVKLVAWSELKPVNPVSFSANVLFPAPTSPNQTTYGTSSNDTAM